MILTTSLPDKTAVHIELNSPELGVDRIFLSDDGPQAFVTEEGTLTVDDRYYQVRENSDTSWSVWEGPNLRAQGPDRARTVGLLLASLS